jgi:hypothetical protein
MLKRRQIQMQTQPAARELLPATTVMESIRNGTRCIMTYQSGDEARVSDVPKTRQSPAQQPGPQRGAWMAALVIAVMLGIVGYFYLQPDVPSPNMRATGAAPVTVPPATLPQSN